MFMLSGNIRRSDTQCRSDTFCERMWGLSKYILKQRILITTVCNDMFPRKLKISRPAVCHRESWEYMRQTEHSEATKNILYLFFSSFRNNHHGIYTGNYSTNNPLHVCATDIFFRLTDAYLIKLVQLMSLWKLHYKRSELCQGLI